MAASDAASSYGGGLMSESRSSWAASKLSSVWMRVAASMILAARARGAANLARVRLLADWVPLVWKLEQAIFDLSGGKNPNGAEGSMILEGVLLWPRCVRETCLWMTGDDWGVGLEFARNGRIAGVGLLGAERSERSGCSSCDCRLSSWLVRHILSRRKKKRSRRRGQTAQTRMRMAIAPSRCAPKAGPADWEWKSSFHKLSEVVVMSRSFCLEPIQLTGMSCQEAVEMLPKLRIDAKDSNEVVS